MINKEQCKLDVTKYLFSQRAVNICNKLPTDCVNATRVHLFKSKIDKYLLKAKFVWEYIYRLSTRHRLPCLYAI